MRGKQRTGRKQRSNGLDCENGELDERQQGENRKRETNGTINNDCLHYAYHYVKNIFVMNKVEKGLKIEDTH